MNRTVTWAYQLRCSTLGQDKPTKSLQLVFKEKSQGVYPREESSHEQSFGENRWPASVRVKTTVPTENSYTNIGERIRT